MVTGYVEGWAGAVSVPLKVEAEPVPGVRVKGPVVTPLTCAVAMQRREFAGVQGLVSLKRLCCAGQEFCSSTSQNI